MFPVGESRSQDGGQAGICLSERGRIVEEGTGLHDCEDELADHASITN